MSAALASSPDQLTRAAPAASGPDVFEITVAAQLVAEGRLSLTDVAVAREKSVRWSTPLGETLTADGKISVLEWAGSVARVMHIPLANLVTDPPQPELLSNEDRTDYLTLGIMPWRVRADGTIVLAATRPLSVTAILWATRRFPGIKIDWAATTKFDVLWAVQQVFNPVIEDEAREALWRQRPELSAKTTLTVNQAIAAWVLVSIFILALWLRPLATMVTLSSMMTVFYTGTFLFRFLLTWMGAHRRVDIAVSRAEVVALVDSELPVFTVLVPMYREADVLPILVESVRRLDYPRSKLDVKLVLEADDDITIDAAKAMHAESLFEIVRVPKSHPKTKPKACNYALRFARGEYCVIFDAEDIPEPDQLKKVVAVFHRSGPEVACVQARLNYFNRDDNYLTRMFTLEYSQWFDYLLPGLHALNVPIPLGGTSNHFRTSTLIGLGAWDPYNVTEDADLGVRMTQEGYRVVVVNSTTFEEANGVARSWINQRSRWIKGYMQTWLVHMRHPLLLRERLGFTAFWGFQLFIGFPPFTALINPILWLIFLMSMVVTPEVLHKLFPGIILDMAMLNLLVGNTMTVYFSIMAVAKRRWYRLVPWGLLVPAYWMMHSIAAYKALWQLVFNPHHWEKTQHGTSHATKQVLANLAGAAASPASR